MCRYPTLLGVNIGLFVAEGHAGTSRPEIREGEKMGRGRDMDGGQPVDPGRARSYGNDPDAVEVHRAGSSGEGRPRAEGLGPDIPASGPTAGRSHEEEVLVSRGSTGTGGHQGAGVRRYGGDGGGGEDLASARRDSIRWGPIWAGLITALTTFLLLQLLAIGLGLVDVGPGSDGGGGWVPGLIGLIAFFTGGAVAGGERGDPGARPGAAHRLFWVGLWSLFVFVPPALWPRPLSRGGGR